MDSTILEKYAELATTVGINLAPQESAVVMTTTAGLPLARAVTKALYRAGALNVIVRITDEEITRARYDEGHDAVFDHFPDFDVDYMESLFTEGYHRIAIVAEDPNLLAGVDADKLRRSSQARGSKMQRLQPYQDAGTTKWTVIAYPTPEWARTVFPDLPEDEALARLGDAIAHTTRLTGTDPVADWQEHVATLKRNEAWLNEQRFESLHYTGPGTDLVIGLADRHLWLAGTSQTPDGVAYLPNMPTEEVFTAPHKDRVNGTLRATKPLSVQGTLIEGMEFRFEDGKVVEFRAEKNGEVLENLMDMDEGARRLGEVALVPHSSPISQSGILFYNTLFDENASCHLALGQAYATTFEGGTAMTEEERAALGANKSMIHIDFMVGGPELDITGIRPDGTEVPVFRGGEWTAR